MVAEAISNRSATDHARPDPALMVPQAGTCGMRDLFEGCGTAAGDWHVLHVKSRQEKALAGSLRGMGILYYLPLLAMVRSHRNRRVIVTEPMFPGYLFLRGTHDQAYRADRTDRVVRIIPVADQQLLDSELRNLDFALRSGARLTPSPFLRAGVRVEIRSGPFRGLQGVIQGKHQDDRLILQVKMLGQAMSLEVDGALLDQLD